MQFSPSHSEQALPATPPIGVNSNTAQLQAACPTRKYHRCFHKLLSARYPLAQFRVGHLLSGCSRRGPPAAACLAPKLSQQEGAKLRTCDATTASPKPNPDPDPNPQANSNPNPNPTRRRGLGEEKLRCGSAPRLIEATALLLLGVPSSPSLKGSERRAAIRTSWMEDERVGSSVVVCFLLSSQTPAAQLAPMQVV